MLGIEDSKTESVLGARLKPQFINWIVCLEKKRGLLLEEEEKKEETEKEEEEEKDIEEEQEEPEKEEEEVEEEKDIEEEQEDDIDISEMDNIELLMQKKTRYLNWNYYLGISPQVITIRSINKTNELCMKTRCLMMNIISYILFERP